MQPVMRSVEKRYGEQLKVIFYDVSQENNRRFVQQYAVRMIPTQVFLDVNGKEFFRHEGYLGERDIDNLLKTKGLKPASAR